MKPIHSNPKSELIFLSILLPYCLGIISAYPAKTSWFLFWLIPTALLLFAALIAINIYYKPLKAYHFKSTTGTLFHLLFFLMGAIWCIANKQHLKSDYYANTQAQYLRISINEEPQLKGNVLRFKALVQQAYQVKTTIRNKQVSYLVPFKVSGMLMVAIRLDTSKKHFKLSYGNTLIIPARFTEIPGPANPSEFDSKAWLATQNIYHRTFLKQQEILKPGNNSGHSHSSGNPIIAFALKLRTAQVAKYRNYIQNDEAVSLAATLILGDRAELSRETLDIYSKTGTIHALSVSGMHVGLIYMLLNHLLAFLNHHKKLKAFKLVFLLVMIWFYALFTGFSPSVLRSVIMLSVFMMAKSFARPANSYNIIAFTAFAILLYHPFLIWDVGFQLSFLAVIGLIYLQPKIQHRWYIENKWLNKLWGTIAMSLAAQLFTFPSSIYYFHQFPLYFLISNLFITIPIALLMYLGIIVLLPGFGFLAPIFKWLIHFTNDGLEWISKLPFSSLSAIWISKTEFTLLCIALTLLVLALVKLQKTLLLASSGTFLMLQISLAYDDIQAHHQKKTIVFKLPKETAICLIFSNSATVYTTLKPEDNAFRYHIQPALSQHKITNITCIDPSKSAAISQVPVQNKNPGP